MTTLKYTVATLVFLFTFSSFAGGGGGGGVMMDALAQDTDQANLEIVYHMGQEDGLVTFAYGQLVENTWQIQKIEIPVDVIEQDSSVVNALEASKFTNNWIKVQ